MRARDELSYDRLCRTSTSEAYLVSREEEPVGRLELHFGNSIVYGLLIVEREMPEAELFDLIHTIDEDLVWSADVPRDDFVVTVYQGRELGVYSDAGLEDEDEDDDGKGEPI
jgi:hypothetical protein